MPTLTPTPAAPTEQDTAAHFASIHTESGASLLALAEQSPVLLIFLRHFGCPFGRKTIGDIADLHPILQSRNVRPVFVHLGSPELAKSYFDFYQIPHVERISDPTAAIYRHPHFALGQSNKVADILDPRIWFAWLKNGTAFKHGIGTYQGDGTQMPGIFFLRGPQILRRFHHRNIADEPDYLALIR